MNALPESVATVVSREQRGGGYVVALKVPRTAEWGSYNDEQGTSVPFLKFRQNVKGGIVYFFLHGMRSKITDIIGQTVLLVATVHDKMLRNGRSYTYINLELAEEGMVVARRLVVTDTVPEGVAETEMFPLAHAAGVISFMSPTAKVKSAAPKKVGPPVVDGQLHRLILAGWKVVSQTETQVNLSRPVSGGGIRTMTHYKPNTRQKPPKK